MISPPFPDQWVEIADCLARETALGVFRICLRQDEQALTFSDQRLGEGALFGVRSAAAALLRVIGTDDPALLDPYQDLVGSLFVSELERLRLAWLSEGGRA